MPAQDPYYDERVGDLRNLLGAKTTDELRALEADIVYANQIAITTDDITRTNDLDELRKIHKFLFGDIYDWAGQTRVVDIAKDSGKAEFFLPVSRIAGAADFVFKELAQNNFLKNLPLDIFVEKLTYFYDQLNYIHPFREGNGRTQRIFWSRVAADAGYEILWEDVQGSENDEACRRAAEESDLSLLKAMFKRIIKVAS